LLLEVCVGGGGLGSGRGCGEGGYQRAGKGDYSQGTAAQK
jgi:hypothetical protein